MHYKASFQEIETAMKQAKKRRKYERYQTLYLYLQGTEIEQFAHMAYQTVGLSGLQMNHSPGAPVRLTSEQQEQLKQTIRELRSALCRLYGTAQLDTKKSLFNRSPILLCFYHRLQVFSMTNLFYYLCISSSNPPCTVNKNLLVAESIQ